MPNLLTDSFLENSAAMSFIVFARIAALTFFLPGIGETYVSARIKTIIAIWISLLIFPIVRDDVTEHWNASPNIARILLSEVLIGLFWGFIIRLIIFALQMAGSIISQATSLAQIFGGTASMDAQPAMGHILVVGGVSMIAIIGLHETYLVYILNTYEASPAGSIINPAEGANFVGQKVTKTFSLAFQLAATALTATLLYNVILGVINRAMPQLLVSFVGAPAITAGGLFILFVLAPTIIQVWLGFVEDVIDSPLTAKYG